MKKIISLMLTLAMLLGCIMIVPTVAVTVTPDPDATVTAKAYTCQTEEDGAAVYIVFSHKITDFEGAASLVLGATTDNGRVYGMRSTEVTKVDDYTLRFVGNAYNYHASNGGAVYLTASPVFEGDKTLPLTTPVYFADTNNGWVDAAAACYAVPFEALLASPDQIPTPDTVTAKVYTTSAAEDGTAIYIVFSEKITSFEGASALVLGREPDASSGVYGMPSRGVTQINDYTLRFEGDVYNYHASNGGAVYLTASPVFEGNKTIALTTPVYFANTNNAWQQDAKLGSLVPFVQLVASPDEIVTPDTPAALSAKAYTVAGEGASVYVIFNKKVTSFEGAEMLIQGSQTNAAENGQPYGIGYFSSSVEKVNDYTLKFDGPAYVFHLTTGNFVGLTVSPVCGDNESLAMETPCYFISSRTWTDAAAACYALPYHGEVASVDNLPVPADEEEAPAADYTASLGTTYAEVTEGQKVTFTVTVDNAFASGEVTLTYDPAVLSFESTTAKAHELADGTLKLATYGEDGQTTIDVVFTAVAVAESTTVTLEKAAFSTAEKAESEDLTAAVIDTATASVSVIPDVYVVTLGDNLATLDNKTGAITVANGTALQFKVSDAFTALYTDIVVKAGDEVLTAEDGVYSIDYAASVTVTGTPKTFNVTVNGDDNTLVTVAPQAPVYGTDFVVTLPDNKQASLTEDGYTYSAKITIGGVDYAVVTEKVTTIAGDKVTGDVVITVTKTPVTKTGVTITVTGETSVAGDYATVATKGEAYTLTITPAAGYAYTVTAKIGDTVVDLAKDGNAYTVAAADVTGDITFEITATVVTEGLSINKYLTLNGTNMWLVKMVGDLAEDKVYKYGDTVMVWSDNYDAYVCLVISAETPALELAIVDGRAAVIEYTNDINGTEVVDANDAQFVYNMYMAMYNDFSSVSMEKFLLADVNADSVVDVADAAAIVAAILA